MKLLAAWLCGLSTPPVASTNCAKLLVVSSFHFVVKDTNVRISAHTPRMTTNTLVVDVCFAQPAPGLIALLPLVQQIKL